MQALLDLIQSLALLYVALTHKQLAQQLDTLRRLMWRNIP